MHNTQNMYYIQNTYYIHIYKRIMCESLKTIQIIIMMIMMIIMIIIKTIQKRDSRIIRSSRRRYYAIQSIR